MNTNLSQTDIDEFASDEDAAKEIPGSPYYANGVDVGYTAPAKWYNWLFNKVTKGLRAIKADKTSVNSELGNLLSSANMTASASDSHQLSKAIDKLAYAKAEEYDEEEVTEEIQGQMVTHKKNQPFVVGHTLYIPDTELL